MKLQLLRRGVLGGLLAAGLVADLPGIEGAAQAQGYKRRNDLAYLPPRRPQASDMRAATPVFAVVSLAEQHISVYGADGLIAQSPVSSGSKGYDTPAGVFSIVQKKPEHNSNLYDDASMPFMQRLTWTGIALHAGVIPGYPASHGCVRLPTAFAERLFDITKLGMRVILTRDDITPQEFSHPALFKPRPVVADVEPMRITRISQRGELPISRLGELAYENVLAPSPAAERTLGVLSAVATEKKQEQQRAARAFAEARQIAQRRKAEAAQAVRAIAAASNSLKRAEAALAGAVKSLEAIRNNPKAKPTQIEAAEKAHQRAEDALAEAGKQLELAKSRNQARIDEAEKANDALKRAELAKEQADEDAVAAERKLSPVSVFVSRKMRRYYVRQANLPIMEGPVTIKDPTTQIGSFVYTALDYASPESNEMKWSVVSLYKTLDDIPDTPAPSVKPNDSAAANRRKTRNISFPADVQGAKSALDRIALPADVVARVSELMVPGSSLIVSDEAPSIETGKDTDFVVVMSNEPQGALKMRTPQPKKERNEWGGGNSSPFWWD